MSEDTNVTEPVANPVDETMFTLKFTGSDLNKILNIIAQLPYANVFALINSIQNQAQAQMAATEAPVTE
jgi:hypothetical protein